MMTLTLIKELSGAQGRAMSNRYRARRFKNTTARDTFLNKGDNSLFWKQCTQGLKAGTYFSQVSVDRETRKTLVKYINVRALL